MLSRFLRPAALLPLRARRPPPSLPPFFRLASTAVSISPPAPPPVPAPPSTSRNGAPDPSAMMQFLDEHIVGQDDAKKAISIAIRERWRRLNVSDSDLAREIAPNNILLSGPSGCGKTEIARRLAKLVSAPFVKVVATNYTEAGFLGDNTDTMVHALAAEALRLEEAKILEEVQQQAKDLARDEIIKAYLCMPDGQDESVQSAIEKFDAGQISHEEIEVDEALTIPPADDMNDPFRSSTSHPQWVRLPVSQAYKFMTKHFSARLATAASQAQLQIRAREACESRGIVFIDEFDKILSAGLTGSDNAFRDKRRGVERELLSLIEGTTVETPKLGKIDTHHVLFVCAGAFTEVNPKSIMPELQGRLPIRAHLKPLAAKDFLKVLMSVKYSIPKQQAALLATEGVTLHFDQEALTEIAEFACKLNSHDANTGVRRLQTLVAKVLEEIKFDTQRFAGRSIRIDREFVQTRLGPILKDVPDASKYIL